MTRVNREIYNLNAYHEAMADKKCINKTGPRQATSDCINNEWLKCDWKVLSEMYTYLFAQT